MSALAATLFMFLDLVSILRHSCPLALAAEVLMTIGGVIFGPFLLEVGRGLDGQRLEVRRAGRPDMSVPQNRRPRPGFERNSVPRRRIVVQMPIWGVPGRPQPRSLTKVRVQQRLSSKHEPRTSIPEQAFRRPSLRTISCFPPTPRSTFSSGRPIELARIVPNSRAGRAWLGRCLVVARNRNI